MLHAHFLQICSLILSSFAWRTLSNVVRDPPAFSTFEAVGRVILWLCPVFITVPIVKPCGTRGFCFRWPRKFVKYVQTFAVRAGTRLPCCYNRSGVGADMIGVWASLDDFSPFLPKLSMRNLCTVFPHRATQNMAVFMLSISLPFLLTIRFFNFLDN